MNPPVVIGHRGACGYRPEHTLASYRLAIALGADYVEPDLVATRDGVLVARHENEISGTTDVAAHPEFADRHATRTIDGTAVAGWFTEDFTLAELRTLRAVERLPHLRPGNTRFDRRYRVPTFEEVLRLVENESRRLGVSIGVYPETKHPSYFASIGLPLEEPLVADLRRHRLDRADAPVFVQSFETGNLRALATELQVPLVQLVDPSGAPADLQALGDPRSSRDLVTPGGLVEVATYARAVGVRKDLVLDDGSTLVQDAHAAGLAVHAWTVRQENAFLAAPFRRGSRASGRGDALGETRALLEAGVDGLFTDHPDTALEARRRWRAAGLTAQRPVAAR
jgi:glycerophosphoryl diester phosphodiesterase